MSHTKQQQVVALGRLGWSLRRIAAETQVHRDTAGAYLRAAGVPVRGRGGRPSVWPPKPATTAEVSTDLETAKPATTPEVSTDLTPSRAPSASACEIYREVITEALSRGRNAMAIWQDLVDDHGGTIKYASVRRFVVHLRGTTPREAHVVITTAPGEEAQVDYGEGPMVRDPASGKYRRVRLFVLTLDCSRKAVRLLTWRSSAQIWAELHERAFRRLALAHPDLQVVMFGQSCPASPPDLGRWHGVARLRPVHDRDPSQGHRALRRSADGRGPVGPRAQARRDRGADQGAYRHEPQRVDQHLRRQGCGPRAVLGGLRRAPQGA